MNLVAPRRKRRPFRRIVGEERERLGRRLRAAYEKGASINALATMTGRSYSATHRLLVKCGTQLRGRDRNNRHKPATAPGRLFPAR